MTHLSIVSPVYKAEKLIPELVHRMEISVRQITDNYEIILVEDGGPDQSWKVIKQIAIDNPRVKGFKLSRNFGQHHAITCGLDHAGGEWVVVMDCDLQDRPEEIPNLYKKTCEGYDAVLARRVDRKDGYLKKLSSKLFYRTLAYLTGSYQDETIANFGIYHKKVINQIVQMRESIRYFPTMVKWIGFRQTSIPVEHQGNEKRPSSYNFKRLLNLALDIMLAYSDKPLRIIIKFGLSVALIGFLFAIYTVFKYVMGGIIVAGYASLIVSLWVLTGFVLITLGMVGLYVGKIFEGIKKRPIYIIEDSVS